MAGALDSFVEKIVQYNGKEQAELRVRIKLPGSWFDGLVGEEKAQQYEAEAFEYVPSHRFAKSRHRSAQTTEALKFLCKSDVHEDPQHAGFIMPVIEWNRYRHYTYKDNREMEVPYIRSIVRPPAPTAAAAAKEDEKPAVYSEFEYVSSGKHVVNSRDGWRKESSADRPSRLEAIGKAMSGVRKRSCKLDSSVLGGGEHVGGGGGGCWGVGGSGEPRRVSAPASREEASRLAALGASPDVSPNGSFNGSFNGSSSNGNGSREGLRQVLHEALAELRDEQVEGVQRMQAMVIRSVDELRAELRTAQAEEGRALRRMLEEVLNQRQGTPSARPNGKHGSNGARADSPSMQA